MSTSTSIDSTTLLTPTAILQDYLTCCISRELSLVIRKEVLTGRAKFGVSDDGKEVFQVAMARAYRPGDWRADYYRGHTLLLALGLATVEDLLAQLYADVSHDPFSRGRQMNNHHATPTVNERGEWLSHLSSINLSSDISTTGGQMARGLGLAFASRVYREADHLPPNELSDRGNELCFCNIGDASTSEGAFWEAVNAASVLQVPLAVTVQDDGYGISVPRSYQTTKDSISAALAGMQAEPDSETGLDIHYAKGWDYAGLCELYNSACRTVRRTHRPALFHIDELTQPQGHSTSGSHERYKSVERLRWEQEFDCNRQFKLWIIATGVATEAELMDIEQRAKQDVRAARSRAWKRYTQPLVQSKQQFLQLLDGLPTDSEGRSIIAEVHRSLGRVSAPPLSELLAIARQLRHQVGQAAAPQLQSYTREVLTLLEGRTSSHLYSESPRATLAVSAVPAQYSDTSPLLNGYEVLNQFFDQMLEQYPNFYAFGEDLGKIGGVNQCFAGLQTKHGEHRVFDTGIREWTIVGQAIGMAMRGLRPLVEIQYLDYLIYAFSPLSDDLATLRWRTAGQQQAPVIIRTRGHRLEGIWHSGSPMSVLLGGLRGIHICVPRNMVQAAGMYNTLLQGDDPGLVIEVLNGYRYKEQLPDNLADYTVPLGVPEILRSGTDLTLVTYGACVRLATVACDRLAEQGISVELIDIQTLLPLDRHHQIGASLARTNRLLIVDEDMPGGGSAYILQHVLQEQGSYQHLDAAPRCLSAKAHRPAYADDGNYTSKPSIEDMVEAALDVMAE